MKGYLAFDGDTCVGWCNANDAKSYVRLSEFVDPLIGDRKVGCIICYVIHPNYRNQGIARKLLRRAVQGFIEEGYEAVLALPVDQVETSEKLYRGTLNMYFEQGFEEIEHHEDLHVMWLKL